MNYIIKLAVDLQKTARVLSCQLELIKMHAKLASLNHYVVPFLSRAAANLCWYDSIHLFAG